MSRPNRAMLALVLALTTISCSVTYDTQAESSDKANTNGSSPESLPAHVSPRSLDPRIKIELFAESPQIVTPTGIDVDGQGRVWAIESNTHFPPEGYAGHPSDRLLVMEETSGDGKADRILTFTDGLVHAMSVAVRPEGNIFVATRKEIFLYRDRNNDLRPDAKPQRIMTLDTPGDYPHNGLAGFAFDALGNLYFGCGENLGADYTLIGTDGTSLSGGGEGGNVYRCRPDGRQLKHWATGFWNPHASCVDAFGRLFTVDNDPDSRPPCRLLHIVAGGDYGYRYRNGRRGIHPFTAWDGELPGTLPMVAGTGEAPSGILAYESDGLPAEYLGNLLVTSWGDHRIDRFRIAPKGGSFRSRAEPIITGGENFRPVGIAAAPDGSLFCTDWVLKEYKLHGQGRIWRISAVAPSQQSTLDVATIKDRPLDELMELLNSPRLEVRRAAAVAMAETSAGISTIDRIVKAGAKSERIRTEALWALLRVAQTTKFDAHQDLLPLYAEKHKPRPAWWTSAYEFDDPIATQLAGAKVQQALVTGTLESAPKEFDFTDPFVYRAGLKVIARFWDEKTFQSRFDLEAVPDQPTRLLFLLAARLKNPKYAEIAAAGLADPDPIIRRTAVQWVGEERLEQFRPKLEAILGEGVVTADLFEAVLASLELLDGVEKKPHEEVSGAQYVMKLLNDEQRPASLRARALRMLPPHDKQLDAKLLGSLLAVDDAALQLETVRTLQHSPLAERAKLLETIVRDESRDVGLRAEAIVGLAPAAWNSMGSPELRELLQNLAQDDSPVLRLESLRSLRGTAADDSAIRRFAIRLAERFQNQSDPLDPNDQAFADQVAMLFSGTPEALPGHLVRMISKRPRDSAEWIERLAGGGDAAAGRRVFFHANSAGCYRCHTVNGRGGRVGPDLSMIARTMDRRKLAESILTPSKEVAPQFVTWTVVTTAGKVLNGLILSETRAGTLRLGDAEGKVSELEVDEIEQRSPQKISIMPEKLVERLTVDEFRDLLAFLQTLK